MWDIALLILSWLFIAFQDNIITWFWAKKYAYVEGPRRARQLIMEDPEYIETRATLKKMDRVLEDMRLEYRNDLAANQKFITGQLDQRMREIGAEIGEISGEISALEGKVSSQLDQSPDLEGAIEKASKRLEDKVALELRGMSIPQGEIDKVTTSIKSSVRNIDWLREVNDIVGAHVDRLIEVVKTGEVDAGDVVTEAGLGNPELQQNIAAWLEANADIPAWATLEAMKKGPKVARDLIEGRGFWGELKEAMLR